MAQFGRPSGSGDGVAASSFSFPQLYNFPPFFTLQRNPQTLASQLASWTRLVLDYCQHHRLFSLDVQGSWERTTGAGGLFRNETIERELGADAIRHVFKALVEQGGYLDRSVMEVIIAC